MYFFEHRNIPVICLNLKLTTLSIYKASTTFDKDKNRPWNEEIVGLISRSITCSLFFCQDKPFCLFRINDVAL